MENAGAEIAKLTDSIQRNIEDSQKLIRDFSRDTREVTAQTIELLSEANESARRTDRLVSRD